MFDKLLSGLIKMFNYPKILSNVAQKRAEKKQGMSDEDMSKRIMELRQDRTANIGADRLTEQIERLRAEKTKDAGRSRGQVKGTFKDKLMNWDVLKEFFANQARKQGYHPAAIVGQKANESARGKSNFAVKRNNFGGIGAYDRNPNAAFSFASPQEYMNYYFKMIEKRFPQAYKVRSNPQAYLQALKKGNYATSPSYVQDIMNTPEYREYQ
jgi:flagellum-specific peptidoglycan hydrolase FlgJ